MIDIIQSIINLLDFDYIIDTYNIYENSHIKSMVKINKLKSIYTPHLCLMTEKIIIYFEENILIENKPVNHIITNKSYNETILIHLHTRSINNLIIKSLNTKFDNKINNILEFNKLINTKLIDNKTLENMKKYIGIKSEIPFVHATNKTIILKNYDIKKYNYNIIDINLEKNLIEDTLKYYNNSKLLLQMQQ